LLNRCRLSNIVSIFYRAGFAHLQIVYLLFMKIHFLCIFHDP
jgi:hypothetical protein